MRIRLAMLAILAACSRSREPQRDKPSAPPPSSITLLAPGRDPQAIASTLQPFTAITMRVVVEGIEQARAFKMTSDFGFAPPKASDDGATFDIAMGALYFEPDTTRNTTGWPLTAVRGVRGDLRSLSTGSYQTDATALEETFGRWLRLMFVPIPAEPIGIGARWEVREKVGHLEESTTFELVAADRTQLQVHVVGTMTDASDGYDAKLDGTLEVPLAPWRPARGNVIYTAHGRRGTVQLALQASVAISAR